MDHTLIRRTNYDVSFKASSLGGLNKIDLSKLELLLAPVQAGTTGAMKLDDRVLGFTDGAQVTVQVREVTRVMIEKAFPWFTGTTGTAAIELSPPINSLLNQYAGALVLHPHDLAVDVITQDIEFYKALPIQPPISRDGMADDVWDLVFKIYPDVSKIAANTVSMYGRFKPAT